MPPKPDERQYRMVTAPLRVRSDAAASDKRIQSDCYVEGYASTFNDPYTLFECSGVEYKEIVSPDAFSETDMSDVILQYNHEGKVLARMSNGTLIVEPDEHGLFVAADLSGMPSVTRAVRGDPKRSRNSDVVGLHDFRERVRSRHAHRDADENKEDLRRVCGQHPR